jgi:hypothetical protein
VFWGYNERSVFDAVLHGIERVSERANMCTSMVIRLHPKENPAYFEKLVAGRGAGRVSLMIDRHTDSVRLIMASNLVCGMSSMFLF